MQSSAAARNNPVIPSLISLSSSFLKENSPRVMKVSKVAVEKKKKRAARSEEPYNVSLI